MKVQKILISPLNWGFGHAGRMIPVALALRNRGHEIVFAADSKSLPMLSHELPGITLMAIRGVQMRYSRLLPQYLAIMWHLPNIMAASVREHFALKRLAAEMHPDIIISDNRFGFFHKNIFSVYVTHMVRIPFPAPFRFLEPAIALLHRKIMERFDLCLIPDSPGDINLSGRLSHDVRLPRRTAYTGPLSRFSSVTGIMPEPATTGPGSALATPEPAIPAPFRCLILSGPDPQRSMLRKMVADAADDMHLVILEGTGEHNTLSHSDNATLVSNPDTAVMKEIISGSTAVICRSGYTTLMELVSLKKGAVIIPTPGQTEQEYLGRSLDGKYGFVMLGQNQINRITEIDPDDLKVVGATDPPVGDSSSLLERALDLLIEEKIKRH